MRFNFIADLKKKKNYLFRELKSKVSFRREYVVLNLFFGERLNEILRLQ